MSVELLAALSPPICSIARIGDRNSKNSMKNNASTTQIINTYLRGQQLLNRHLQLCQTIKKANRTRQSNRSAFRTQAIKLNNVDYLNQLTHGVNQYE